ncbi:hypothetical protein Sjap_013292 [Stephania japonica]|uniref:Uncharacterized protein n=1 Tax=Stephania japonica TaxID=461633 RepID=A0AAP0IYU4_9MAGN
MITYNTSNTEEIHPMNHRGIRIELQMPNFWRLSLLSSTRCRRWRRRVQMYHAVPHGVLEAVAHAAKKNIPTARNKTWVVW